LANASYIVTRQSGVGTTNGIVPKFTNVSLQDDWRPNDKLDLNLGVRFENYTYDLVNSNTPQFNFWFNAAQHVYCYDPVTLQPILNAIQATAPPPATPVVTAFGAPCPVGPSGQPGRHPDGQNGNLLFTAASPSSLSHSLFSPRVGGTYSFDPDTVLRFSAGRYSQPTPAAFEQYLNQYGLSAAQSDFSHFFGFGFRDPAHDNPVQTSNNFDFSLEKHLKNTDFTLKLSPFYRYTTHQAVTLSLGPNFVSAVNLGTQRSAGVELQVQKGDFSRDGWSGFLSYTYTDAKIRYENAPNGTNAVDVLNNYIKGFNGLTKGGGGSQCYQFNPNSATSGVSADIASPNCSVVAIDPATGLATGATAANVVSNVYYNTPVQGLLDRTGWYPTYENYPPGDPTVPAGFTAISPNFFSGVIQWKHDKLAIAPNFQLAQGGSYGGPTDIIGVDPRTCHANQAGTGAVSLTSPYAQDADYFHCGASLSTETGFLAVPASFNGNRFLNVAQYQEPWQFNLGMQVRYDVSQKITAVLNLANVYNHCFGGSSTPWSREFSYSQNCAFAENTFAYTGTVPGSGFFYGASPTDAANGTAPYSPILRSPYLADNGGLPFQAYLEFQIKL
jgi:hypothetical protein